jgi:hypothetical protein
VQENYLILLRRLGLFAIIFFTFLIAIMSLFNLGEDLVFNPPHHTLFITGTILAVAVISAKSYLKEGSPGMLILGLIILRTLVSEISELPTFRVSQTSSTVTEATAN